MAKRPIPDLNADFITKMKYAKYIKQQIIEDIETPNVYSHHFHPLKGIDSIRHNGENELMSTTSVVKYFISIDKLIAFLFDESFNGENKIFGFWIWFTEDNNELILVKAGTGAKLSNLTEDYMLLTNNVSKVAKPGDILKKPSINKLKVGFKGQIKGYYIGRLAIVGKLLNDDTNIDPNITGIEIEVRKNPKNKQCIVFNVVYKKSKLRIGWATYFIDPNPIAGGGGASSRPCPTYCADE